ncbi:MAG: hypothetical protein M1815_005181 [Lichina confinis]|nr:MAG: hypothetical protein M1815_005181 [Lichina confinis]
MSSPYPEGHPSRLSQIDRRVLRGGSLKQALEDVDIPDSFIRPACTPKRGASFDISPEFTPSRYRHDSPGFADVTPDDLVQAVWNHAALVANASILSHQETSSATESDSNSGSFIETRIRAPTQLFLPSSVSAGAYEALFYHQKTASRVESDINPGSFLDKEAQTSAHLATRSCVSAGACEATLYHQKTASGAETDASSGAFLDNQSQISAHLPLRSYVSAGGDLVLETVAPVVPPYNPARFERTQPAHVMPRRRADEIIAARACEDREHTAITAGELEDPPRVNVVGNTVSVEATEVKAQQEGQPDEKRAQPGPSPRAGTGPSGFSRLRQAWEARAGGKTVTIPREGPTGPA